MSAWGEHFGVSGRNEVDAEEDAIMNDTLYKESGKVEIAVIRKGFDNTKCLDPERKQEVAKAPQEWQQNKRPFFMNHFLGLFAKP